MEGEFGVLDYYESPRLSRLRCLIIMSPLVSRLECLFTTNVQNAIPERPNNELIGCKNLRSPSYYILMVCISSHQLLGDANHQDR